LCWINFAKNIGSSLPTSTDTETTVSVSNDVKSSNTVVVSDVKKSENKITKYVAKLDSYVDKLDSKWYDNMFNKGKLSMVDVYYTYFLTNEIASSQVLLGSDNWLFYKSSTEGDSIADYEGTNRYSSEAMSNILNQALATQEELESRNIKFEIMVAPNKENVYSKYMPNTYTHSEVSSTDLLIDYLAENGVNIVSPKQELLANHDEFQLYYSYDTHWNQLGAYIGVKNVLASWNISKPTLAERSISSYNLAGNYHECGEDDLAKMIGMRESLFNDEIEYEIDGTEIMDWEEFEKELDNNAVQYFNNPDAQINAKLLLVGDSFRIAMLPSLRETFSDVYVINRLSYSSKFLNEIEPDYLIAEYVERYSSKIGKISSLVK
jgi:hypothetical protein